MEPRIINPIYQGRIRIIRRVDNGGGVRVDSSLSLVRNINDGIWGRGRWGRSRTANPGHANEGGGGEGGQAAGGKVFYGRG